MTEKLDPKSADDILKKYDKESDTMMYKGVMAKIVSAIVGRTDFHEALTKRATSVVTC